jgi:hypothetical protein
MRRIKATAREYGIFRGRILENWSVAGRLLGIAPRLTRNKVALGFALLLVAMEGRSEANYDWYGTGSWNGQVYYGYSAFSAAAIAYYIGSFGGPDNATLTDSDPGTCATAPTGPDQACQFNTSYFVQSSGATPTLPGYMHARFVSPCFERREEAQGR